MVGPLAERARLLSALALTWEVWEPEVPLRFFSLEPEESADLREWVERESQRVGTALHMRGNGAAIWVRKGEVVAHWSLPEGGGAPGLVARTCSLSARDSSPS
ncbi:MAG: hypothetical protein AB7N76_07060 [Planctomycetota bacterium]